MYFEVTEKLIDIDCVHQNEDTPEHEDNQQNKKFEPICEYDEKQWPTTIDDEEKFFETNESNDQMMDSSEVPKGIDLLETTTNTFNKDLFLDLLVLTYPFLKEELIYCAPELIWVKINALTGIDIENVEQIFNEYNKGNSCDNCSENKKILKRKFVETIFNDNNKRQC